MQITFTVSDDKAYRIVDAMMGLHPKPVEFTAAQWAKECIRRWVCGEVGRWEQMKAFEAVQFIQDDSLVE